MKTNKKMTLNERCLIRRYLIWAYKTTKESLDRIDRYFTQLKVDHFLLAELSRQPAVKDSARGSEYLKKVNEFQTYIEEKAERVLPQKFSDVKLEKLQPEYWYLKVRLKALEDAIVYFLGKSELKKIQKMYESEMTKRILEAKEHT
jgi:hypothetical protein